jgi:helix-turn-helix protein
MPDNSGPGAGVQGQPGRPVPARRRLTDAPSLQALTHPTRLALIEAIAIAGTLTATQASAQVGESPTACAYHLRTMARLGFIEEAGGGHGRERPWRLVHTGMSVPDSDDPLVAAAGEALTKALVERFLGRIRAFELARAQLDPAVQAVTGVMQSVVFATPAEIEQLRAEILALLLGFADRIDPAARPPGSKPFELVLFTHLLNLSGPGATDA